MFSKIVVGYDGSDCSEDALLFARVLGEIGPGSVTAAFVWGYRRSTRISSRTGEFALTIHDAERTLALLRERLGDEIEVRPVAGLSAREGLQDLAEDEDACLIVVGSTARGRTGRTLPGTTAERLLGGAPCAVALAPFGYRDQAAIAVRRVGAAYGGGEEATAALGVAHAIATECRAELSVIAVLDRAALPPDQDVVGARRVAEKDLDDALASLGDAVCARGHLVDGSPVDVLRERTANLDLLVMGSRALGPIRRVVLGSVSHGVLVDALCPVLVVPRGVSPA